MTHDPLCFTQQWHWKAMPMDWDAEFCMLCPIIERVREDMLGQCIAAVEATQPSPTIDPDAMWVWEESIAALRALQDKP